MSMRVLASVLCICLAISSFFFGYDMMSINMLIAMFLWTSGFIFLVLAIAVLFHGPSGYGQGRVDSRRAGIRTDHELRRDSKAQRERELLNVRMDQHMVDRKW